MVRGASAEFMRTAIFVDGEWRNEKEGMALLYQKDRSSILQAAYEAGKQLGELAIRFGDTGDTAPFERAMHDVQDNSVERYIDHTMVRQAFWQGARGMPLMIQEKEIREMWEYEPERTLVDLAAETGVPYDSLAKAAREGRITARRSGATWLSTRKAIDDAIETGKLRPQKRR